MSWLEDITDVLGLIGGLGSAAAGIYSLFEDQPKPVAVPPQFDAYNAAAQRSAQIAAQLANPNDPGFLALAAQEEEKGRRDLIEALNQLRINNQRATARTGMGTLNPERRDEAISMATARGFMEAQDRARQNARAYLQQSLAANNAAAGQFFNAAQFQSGLDLQNQQIAQTNRRDTASGFQGIFSTLASLGQPRIDFRSLLNGNPKQTQSRGYSPSDYWSNPSIVDIGQ